jgi:hypothetical protein
MGAFTIRSCNEANYGRAAAQNFVACIEVMQRELFISYLRFPRSVEKIVFQRYK